MIAKRLTQEAFDALPYKKDLLGNSIHNTQAAYLRALRRSVSILYNDHILSIYRSANNQALRNFEMQQIHHMIVDAADNYIRGEIHNASFETLNSWLTKGIALLRKTPYSEGRYADEIAMIINAYDTGNIYYFRSYAVGG